MIKKFVSGTPFNTEAIVDYHSYENNSLASLPYFNFTTDQSKLILEYRMSDTDAVYGLGEANRGINKRGGRYVSFCSDDPCHTEEKVSLYGAHNFIIVKSSKTFGLFIDCPSEVIFDIGFERYDILSISCVSDVAIFLITGTGLYDIVKQFRAAIGTSFIPPRWAFGYQQCRWSYMSEAEIREVVHEHRKNNIPLDAVYMDIDYMDSYKDFTVNDSTFPDLPAFVREMSSMDIHLVPIIDAGVKIEKDYDVYEEGVANDYFCKTEDGENFTAAVWPGLTHFPDFLNPEVREWFGAKYRFLTDQGIDGFWNDMNEPALFHTPEGIMETYEKASVLTKLEADPSSSQFMDHFYSLKDTISRLNNRLEDYGRIYHNVNGQQVNHLKLHNLYGYNMTRAAGEALEKISPDKRILLFSRSSYIGMHRYGGIWTGDNMSWWSHILLSMKMMPSLNMCGFLYSGSDIGGFGCNCSRQLVLRWLGFGLFTPLMRNHAALGTRLQEVYRFENIHDFKNVIEIRYALLPYLYSEFVKAALKDEMYFRPLAFDYPDDAIACGIEDQLMVGEGLMISPIYTDNTVRRYVYLPEDMLFIKFKGFSQRTFEVLKKGDHCIEVGYDEVPVFVKKNHMLLLTKPAQSSNALDYYNYLAYVHRDSQTSVTYELYNDDGYTRNLSLKDNISPISIDESGKLITATGYEVEVVEV